MRKFILSAILLTMLATLCCARQSASTNVSEVPFTLTNGLVVVEARIKGSVPVNVILSTGIEYSLTDLSLLEKYKLPSYYAADGPVTGRNDRTYSYTRVTGVSIGDSKAKELDMRYGPMEQLSQIAGREIFAALGADFFEGQIVQFDFKKKVLRFPDKSPVASKKDKNAVASSSVILRMGEKASNPFMRTYLLPIVRDVTFNGKEARLLLDTGRATSLAFSSSVAKNVGFTLPLENGDPREDKVGTLQLGTSEMADVPAMIYAKGTNAEKSLSRYGVVAGTLFLQNFIATFDFQNKVVILERI